MKSGHGNLQKVVFIKRRGSNHEALNRKTLVIWTGGSDCGRWSLMRGGYKLRTFDCIRWKCCQPRLCSNRAWWPLKLHFCSWATRKSYFFHTNHMLGTLDFTVSEHPGLPLIFVRAQSWQRWIHSVGLQGSLGGWMLIQTYSYLS